MKGGQLRYRVGELRALLDVLRTRPAELGGYRMELTVSGVWSKIRDVVNGLCTPQGLTRCVAHGLGIMHDYSHHGVYHVLYVCGNMHDQYLEVSLTMPSIGITLLRKTIPVEEYFANIEAHFDQMPTQADMRSQKGTIPLTWQKNYGLLVNAFGWNSGRTSKHAARWRGVGINDDEDHTGDANGEEHIPNDVAGMDVDPTHAEAAAAGEAVEIRDQDATLQQGRDLLTQDLKALIHPKRPDRHCAQWKASGGVTKSFPTLDELYDWVWQKFGATWRDELKTKLG